MAHGGPLCCASAARAHGLWVLEGEEATHVWLGPDGRAHRHEGCDCIPHRDAAARAGGALVSVEHCLAQLLGCCGQEAFFAALESALRLRRLAGAGRARLRARLPAIHRWLVDLARDDADSGLESLLRLRLHRLGIELRAQVPIPGVGVVDFVLGDCLILEADGRTHDGTGRHRDLVRDAVAMSLGFVTLRFDYALIVHEWPLVEQAILAAVGRGLHRSAASLRREAVVSVRTTGCRHAGHPRAVRHVADLSCGRPSRFRSARAGGRDSLGPMTHAGNPFGQVLVALVTPMTADGEVDWPGVEKHIDSVIAGGADGIVVTGTTGETSTLTDAEKLRLVKVGKDVAAGRAKIITGGGSNETAHAIELYKASEKAGADGIMIVTPYYNKPTQAGILTHFRLVADATDLPVILYDIPGRTGVPIKYETILRLAKHPNILAIKDAKGDFSEVSRVLNQTDLLYFSGDDANVLPHLAIGAAGLIGVTANITAAPTGRSWTPSTAAICMPRPPSTGGSNRSCVRS